eukprot:m.81597 g.81597  ORF g.81597 m.81597 type:complete len:56 (+) comp12062_c0_seq2:1167-1334(+)
MGVSGSERNTARNKVVVFAAPFNENQTISMCVWLVYFGCLNVHLFNSTPYNLHWL